MRTLKLSDSDIGFDGPNEDTVRRRTIDPRQVWRKAFPGGLIISYLIAPAKVLDELDGLGIGIRSRPQFEYAALLVFDGVMFVGIGWSRV